MGWFGKIVGGTTGFFVAGPFGALAGAGLGHLFDKSAENESIRIECPNCGAVNVLEGQGRWECQSCQGILNYLSCPHCSKGIVIGDRGNWKCPHCGSAVVSREDKYNAMFVGLFGLFAKIMRADGRIKENEKQVVNEVLRREFQFGRQDIKDAWQIMEDPSLRKKTTGEIASELYNHLKDEPQTLYYFLEFMKSIAEADNNMHSKEAKLLQEIAGIFNIDHFEVGDKKTKTQDLDESYELLGCSKDSSMKEIKKSYREKVQEYHPDKISSKDLPDDFVDFAEKKFQEIQQAYENIKQGRG